MKAKFRLTAGVFFGTARSFYLTAANTGLPTALWLPQVQTGDANFGARKRLVDWLTMAAIGTVLTMVLRRKTNPSPRFAAALRLAGP
jgi:hypothetical protein